jgi:hypothetical protein
MEKRLLAIRMIVFSTVDPITWSNAQSRVVGAAAREREGGRGVRSRAHTHPLDGVCLPYLWINTISGDAFS